MTPTQRCLAEIDRRFMARFRVGCSTTLRARAASCACGAHRVERDAEDRLRFFVQDELGDAAVLDGLKRPDMDCLADALGQVLRAEELDVQLGGEHHRLRLRHRRGAPPERALEQSRFFVTVESEVVQGRAAYHLGRYLDLLGKANDALLRSLHGVQAHIPAAIRQREIVCVNEFLDGAALDTLICKVDITLGCNQVCLFCCTRQRRRPFPLEDIRGALERLKRQAADHPERVELQLSGGEPTIHPGFLDAVRLARELGFGKIGLNTNALRLGDPELTRAMHELGVTPLIISLHAHRPELYDRLTGTRNGLARFEAGIAELARYPFGTLNYNTVINRHNYTELPALVDYIAALPHHPESQVFFSPSIVYMWRDNGNWADVAVSHTDVVPFLREAYRAHPGMFLNMDGDCFMPICIAREHSELFALAPTVRCDSPTVYLEERRPRQVPDQPRIKHVSCRRCRYDPQCGGVCTLYARTFGLEELEPIE